MKRRWKVAVIAIFTLSTLILEGAFFPVASFPEQDAKITYQESCANCHGVMGKGDGLISISFPVKPRDFTDCNIMKGVPDDSLFNIIKKGGVATGKYAGMPPFEGALSNDQIKDMVTFIRSFCKP